MNNFAYQIADSAEQANALPNQGYIEIVTDIKPGIPAQQMLQALDQVKCILQEVDGLRQQYFCQFHEANYGGVLIWQSKAQADKFRNSYLGKSLTDKMRLAQPPSIKGELIFTQIRKQEIPDPGKPGVVLFISGLEIGLGIEAALVKIRNRNHLFEAVTGLRQKYYSWDQGSGAYRGIYIFDSEEHLVAFRNSDLRKSTAEAYQLRTPPIINRATLISQLNPVAVDFIDS